MCDRKEGNLVAAIVELDPRTNPCHADRAAGWETFLAGGGGRILERYIALRLGDETAGEDIYQDTIMEAFIALENQKTGIVKAIDDRRFIGYLLGIARHKILKEIRRGDREQPLDTVEMETLEFEHGTHGRAEHQFDHARFRATFTLLSGIQKRVLRLYLVGFSVSEIARKLKLTANNVSQIKRRAIKTLRTAL